MRPTLVTGLAAAAATLAALPAAAEVLLDYGDAAFLSGSPFYSQAEQRRIAAALAEGPEAARFADGFAVRGDATGAFTRAGTHERVFLIQEEAASALEPFPETGAPVLLILDGDEPFGLRRLPDDVQYQRLVAAADTDGDGRDEIFLETSFMNMGQTTMSLDVASIGDGETATILETLEEVYFDGCENPAGDRTRSAATISVADGVVAERFDEACPR